MEDAKNKSRIERDLIRDAFKNNQEADDYYLGPPVQTIHAKSKAKYEQFLNYLSPNKLAFDPPLQSVYDLPIPGLTKPEPPAKVKQVEPVIASQHEGRKFR